MQRNGICAAALTVLVVVGLCACSQQKRLADRVAEADRVIFASNLGYEDLRMAFTGQEVKKIIQALANGRKLNPFGLACSPEFRLERLPNT
jgi:hypothetical protein